MTSAFDNRTVGAVALTGPAFGIVTAVASSLLRLALGACQRLAPAFSRGPGGSANVGS